MKKAVIAVVVLLLFIFSFIGCEDQKRVKALEEGRQLLTKHCQSCHQLPNPETLDKKTWANYVLPKMGQYLGFRYFGGDEYMETNQKQQVMSLEDWNKLTTYVLTTAPQKLDTKSLEIKPALNQFAISMAAFKLPKPATTYVEILENQNKVFFGDGLSQQLYKLSANLELEDSIEVVKGIANVYFNDSEIKVLTMGVLHPSDERVGKLTVQNLRNKKTYTLFDSLQRPVFAEYNYINEDSLQDIVVCEFGNNYGQLSWFENKGKNKFEKHILRALPGAVRTKTIDLNRDGRPDIIALMAQGDEGFFVYYNKGGGRFEEKRIMQFPPSFGSNFFELTDFNKDGFADILATNGDNGDYPPILKPYHGIRVYLNDGKNHFKESLFLPMNGASKAIAEDFDEDGDLDIASISFFPDYSHMPNESFVYWENKDGSFIPSTFETANAGRWLTMDTGDLDGDGDIDIALGNAKFPLGRVPDWLMKKWDKEAPSVLLLRNKKR